MRAAALTAALLAALLALVLILRRSDQETTAPASAKALEQTTAEQVTPGSDSSPDSILQSTRIDIAKDTTGPLLRSRLVSPSGDPITDATLSWTAFTLEDVEWEPSWQDDDWGPLPRSVATAESDAEGHFSFASRPAGSESYASVVWATAPGFLADARLLAASDVPETFGTWTLHEAPPLVVRVIDVDGNPVSGAQVDQYGLVTGGVARGDDLGRAKRLLARSAITGSNGEAPLGAFSGEQVVVASLRALRSPPRRVQRATTLTLQLRPTFTLQGSATFDSWEHLNYVGERRILIEVQRNNVFVSLASLRKVEEGAWGPIEVPLVPDAQRFRVRLEGSPIIPVDEYFDPPAAGSRMHFDLHGAFGHDAWFAAANEKGEWLYDAEARVSWRDADPPYELHHVERRARPDDGRIAVFSLPAGGIEYEIGAPGYAPIRDSLAIPLAEPATISVMLMPAGKIRGRCLSEGRPVEAFEVAVWPAQYPPFRKLYSFIDRQDGEFEIDEAPEGEVRITAGTAGVPFGEPLPLTIARDRTAEVVIDLRPPVVGVGQVVDAVTGSSVSTAQVQLYLSSANRILAPWGLPHPVNAEGFFEIAGFVPGANRITISADGYAPLATAVNCGSDESFQDFGTLALFRPQELEVRLLGSVPTPLSHFRLGAEGPTPLDLVSFPSDGVLRVEQFSPGYTTFDLRAPDDSKYVFSIEFEPGKTWKVERPISGPRELEIVPVCDDREELERATRIHLNFRSQRGYWVQCFHDFEPGQPVRVAGIDADSVQVSVLDAMKQEVLGTASAGFGDAGFLRLEVPLETSTLRVKVVDPEGNPLPDVTVTVFVLSDASQYLQSVTGIDGLCTILGVPSEPIEFSMRHKSLGHRHRIPADATVREHSLVLAADASIELQLLDGAKPVDGVACVFLATRGVPTANPLSSGADGRVSLTGLTPETYRIRCTHPDYWTVEQDIEARTDAVPIPVQIRRLGDVTLQVLAPSGLPVKDVPIELRSTEFETSVMDWIVAGRAKGPAELLTDNRGEVTVSGLPHGAYDWRATLIDGSQLEGSLTVVPGQKSRVPIACP